ncbi:MAG: HAMP domain-containing histidine kinase [Francisellaceae bacterium]|nr:HAMP domain-containing histidine kinase [Francisellaceae bacterium]
MPLVIWIWLWFRARAGFYQLLSSFPKSIVIMNKKGYVKWWNIKAKDEFPDWCDPLVCITHVDVIDKDSWTRHVSTLTAGQRSVNLPVLKIAEGEYKQHIVASCSLLPFNPRKILIVLDDVTKEADLEERLIQVDKMATLGLLSSSVIHDVNNFLSGTIQSTQNISRKLSVDYFRKKGIKQSIGVEPEELHAELSKYNVYKTIENISIAMQQASQVSNNVLQYARQDNYLREDININNIVADVLNLVKMENSVSYSLKQKSLFINVVLEEGLPVADAILIRIEQVIMNLIQNALYAAMAHSEESAVKIKTYSDNDNIYLSINDNGPGLEKHQLNKIFKPFYTTKTESIGTGLGLYICKEIICEQHSGDIIVDTEQEVGVTFTIKLPKVRGG